MDAVSINGAIAAYRHRPGLGRTIVFANALGSDQSIWDKVIAALPRGYGILTYDLRGHGQSEGAVDGVEGLADDLSQLIDHLGLTDVLFCGVSVGGMIGQVLAARRHDVVRGAVLCNTAPQIGTADRWNTRISIVQEHGLRAAAEQIVGNWFGQEYAGQIDLQKLHRAMLARTNRDAYIATCKAIRDADLRETASGITVPLLCVGGAEDHSVTAQDVENLSQIIPNATFEILDGIGHMPPLEAPEALAALITSFDPNETDLEVCGTAIRRTVLGAAHVDKANAQTSVLDQAFQKLVTTGAWGQVWSSPAISARERSMLTLALLAALGNFDEIPMHIRATRRTGATVSDIAEVFQHVAIYAGVPRANHALKLAKETLAEMAMDD